MPEQNVTESALADKLKNTCAEVFKVPREYFDSQDLKEVPFANGPKTLTEESILGVLLSFNAGMNQGDFYDKYRNIIGMELPTPRKIAQIVGTEILRAAGDQDIHCKNVNLNDEITIISDLRFPNEFDYFSNNSEIDFIPLYIQRDEAEKHVTEDSHPSEKCVFEFSDKCIKVDNNGTIEDLSAQVWSKLLELGLAGDTPKRA
jgi:hypothetical protein